MSRYDHATNLVTGPEPASAAAEAGQVEVPVEIRVLARAEEYRACIELQYRTWGNGYREAVPAAVLQITQKMGGVLSGAFLASGELAGFVYGLTGIYRGRSAHWSHMLAVAPEHRNHGIGYRLKLHQREQLDRTGVEMMYWTFDPLVARNAHLNVNRLGVKLMEYVPDMYSDTGSDLHVFGTDRFVAEWPVRGGRETRAELNGASRTSPVLNGGAGVVPPQAGPVRVEIPADAESMRDHSLAELRSWRESTREILPRLMDRGYQVTGFYREGDRCYYVLSRTSH
jgi:predicted GNAT superfamily acetyltransferase